MNKYLMALGILAVIGTAAPASAGGAMADLLKAAGGGSAAFGGGAGGAGGAAGGGAAKAEPSWDWNKDWKWNGGFEWVGGEWAWKGGPAAPRKGSIYASKHRAGHTVAVSFQARGSK